ncbi:MbtH family NRPS accessory protein [Streptomyces sp. NBC_01387]|uniref:MbtH family NRPS accessory protein n=1 Tax=unclassified Streptomyces TaxID=2593676 RepID=UPI00202583B4|nr:MULTISPECIES: MbtH family NRPS accessory protein [unclassified Streptomyces]MCX4551222.1 MbtH family NRPS accessory protein [Streptomyces sp. NBC_01500]WSC22618.1 MbtH family NRPS accessory protein [Streptomyces sp. NBC_01766]WSV56461.1 MbtH family NRPS accessory protein [Streptomyces sp. NBC_01014]
MFDEENGQFVVVVNQWNQMSIWPDSKQLPLGWHRAEFSGSKENCLNHIRETWQDISNGRLHRSIGQ